MGSCLRCDAKALWKCRPTKPISSKVPYYLFCLFFFLLVVVSIASLMETHGLLQQARNDLVIWSEAHQEKWATKDHVPPITMQKKTPHLICRPAWRAIYGALRRGIKTPPKRFPFQDLNNKFAFPCHIPICFHWKIVITLTKCMNWVIWISIIFQVRLINISSKPANTLQCEPITAQKGRSAEKINFLMSNGHTCTIQAWPVSDIEMYFASSLVEENWLYAVTHLCMVWPHQTVTNLPEGCTCGCGPLLCMAGILVPFSNEMITGVRGLVGPLLYMVELSKHHLI